MRSVFVGNTISDYYQDLIAQNVLEGLLALPAEELFEIAERLGQSLLNRNDFAINEEDGIVLDRRYQEFLADPEEGQTWEEVEAEIRASLEK